MVDAALRAEMMRSQPDYVVYVPKSLDGSTFDTRNEHFLVFEGPDGSLMAIWTQSSYEGAGDHRILFSRSEDEASRGRRRSGWLAPSALAMATWPAGASRWSPNPGASMSFGTSTRESMTWCISTPAPWIAATAMIWERRGRHPPPCRCRAARMMTRTRAYLQLDRLAAADPRSAREVVHRVHALGEQGGAHPSAQR